jgi:hypothetical protein
MAVTIKEISWREGESPFDQYSNMDADGEAPGAWFGGGLAGIEELCKSRGLPPISAGDLITAESQQQLADLLCPEPEAPAVTMETLIDSHPDIFVVLINYYTNQMVAEGCDVNDEGTKERIYILTGQAMSEVPAILEQHSEAESGGKRHHRGSRRNKTR